MSGQNNETPETAIKAQPAVGAYLCESTEQHAAYWLNAARVASNNGNYDDAILYAEQAVNGWKNLAYALAKLAHYYTR